MNNINTSQNNTINSGGIRIYIIGFILSIILTTTPFWLVINNINFYNKILWIITGASIAQILVHLICFVHINTSLNDSWNFIAFLFALLIVSIIIIGSLWIMHNLNTNMMLY